MAMATLGGARPHEARGNWLAAMGAAWRAVLARRAERASLARARHLGPRLRADMGLAPDDGLFGDGWEALRNNLIVRRRR